MAALASALNLRFPIVALVPPATCPHPTWRCCLAHRPPLPSAKMAPPASRFRRAAAFPLARLLPAPRSPIGRRAGRGREERHTRLGMAAASGRRLRSAPRRPRLGKGSAASGHGKKLGSSRKLGAGKNRGDDKKRGDVQKPGDDKKPGDGDGVSGRKDPFPGPAPLPRARVKKFLRGGRREGGGVWAPPAALAAEAWGAAGGGCGLPGSSLGPAAAPGAGTPLTPPEPPDPSDPPEPL
ncbi:WD repeat-containing protein 46 [Melanerpes formicivorus]|uniref:WD repeat-containing protein 46 n=1 Tax=Melanerpes formicivorus TaxID=211600 RepID=UPI00358E923D